jgi:hypothetical protein
MRNKKTKPDEQTLKAHRVFYLEKMMKLHYGLAAEYTELAGKARKIGDSFKEKLEARE